MEVVNKAFKLAEAAHAGQFDKMGNPYITHPQAVAAILVTSPSFHKLNQLDKTYALAAAYLHDVVEDTHITEEYLTSFGFPKEIIDSVRLLTYDKLVTREDYYSSIVKNDVARTVKISDLVHNNLEKRMVLLPENVQERLKKKYAISIKYIVPEEELEWFNSSISK